MDQTDSVSSARPAPTGFGWQRDIPDFRDFSPDTDVVQALLNQLPPMPRSRAERMRRIDLREFFPGVYDQQQLKACTAHACIGMLQYFERRSHGRIFEPSRLFLYRNTRRLMHVTGDTGADLRTTLKAMVDFGMPPEHYWPYDVEILDAAPEAHLYSYADRYRGIYYVRLDAPNATGAETLQVIKSFLAAGFPAVFGFPVPTSLTWDGSIQYRPTFDSVRGGQSMVAVGFDDNRVQTSKGALRIRSSWGAGWGDRGYGWLPYAFVEERLAVDFWTILRLDWIQSDEFHRPLL